MSDETILAQWAVGTTLGENGIAEIVRLRGQHRLIWYPFMCPSCGATYEAALMHDTLCCNPHAPNVILVCSVCDTVQVVKHNGYSRMVVTKADMQAEGIVVPDCVQYHVRRFAIATRAIRDKTNEMLDNGFRGSFAELRDQVREAVHIELQKVWPIL